MISKDIVETLKQRAKEMLNDDYSRKIGDEELYTIICEWENSLKELETYKKIAEKLAEKIQIGLYRNIDKPRDEICVKNEGTDICKNNDFCIECIIDWARKEVEDDSNNN